MCMCSKYSQQQQEKDEKVDDLQVQNQQVRCRVIQGLPDL
jgi:hypothetical protein